MRKNSTIPLWILNLKPGTYVIRDLMKITGLTRSNINKHLKKYGVRIEPHRHPDSNIIYYVYIWDGYNRKDSV